MNNDDPEMDHVNYVGNVTPTEEISMLIDETEDSSDVDVTTIDEELDGDINSDCEIAPYCYINIKQENDKFTFEIKKDNFSSTSVIAASDMSDNVADKSIAVAGFFQDEAGPSFDTVGASRAVGSQIPAVDGSSSAVFDASCMAAGSHNNDIRNAVHIGQTKFKTTPNPLRAVRTATRAVVSQSPAAAAPSHVVANPSRDFTNSFPSGADLFYITPDSFNATTTSYNAGQYIIVGETLSDAANPSHAMSGLSNPTAGLQKIEPDTNDPSTIDTNIDAVNHPCATPHSVNDTSSSYIEIPYVVVGETLPDDGNLSRVISKLSNAKAELFKIEPSTNYHSTTDTNRDAADSFNATSTSYNAKPYVIVGETLQDVALLSRAITELYNPTVGLVQTKPGTNDPSTTDTDRATSDSFNDTSRSCKADPCVFVANPFCTTARLCGADSGHSTTNLSNPVVDSSSAVAGPSDNPTVTEPNHAVSGPSRIIANSPYPIYSSKASPYKRITVTEPNRAVSSPPRIIANSPYPIYSSKAGPYKRITVTEPYDAVSVPSRDIANSSYVSGPSRAIANYPDFLIPSSNAYPYTSITVTEPNIAIPGPSRGIANSSYVSGPSRAIANYPDFIIPSSNAYPYTSITVTEPNIAIPGPSRGIANSSYVSGPSRAIANYPDFTIPSSNAYPYTSITVTEPNIAIPGPSRGIANSSYVSGPSRAIANYPDFTIPSSNAYPYTSITVTEPNIAIPGPSRGIANSSYVSGPSRAIANYPDFTIPSSNAYPYTSITVTEPNIAIPGPSRGIANSSYVSGPSRAIAYYPDFPIPSSNADMSIDIAPKIYKPGRRMINSFSKITEMRKKAIASILNPPNLGGIMWTGRESVNIQNVLPNHVNTRPLSNRKVPVTAHAASDVSTVSGMNIHDYQTQNHFRSSKKY